MVDEIIVRGTPLEPRVPIFRGPRVDAPTIPEGVKNEPPIKPPFPGDPGPGAFVPPVLPVVIEEIIATAPRPTTSAPSFIGKASRAFRVTPSLLFGVVGGLLLGKTLEELSQQRLEAEFAELMARDRVKPDTPLQTLAAQTIPEIVVTASRLQPSLFLQPIPQPSPLITPDFDPGIMVPFLPRTLPATPAALPQVEIETPTAPQVRPAPATIPLPQPFRIPLPGRTVVPLPVISPQRTVSPSTRPAVLPLPFAQPLPSPAVRPQVSPFAQTSPLTRFQEAVRTSLRRQVSPRTQLAPQAARANCPPCPKPKKERKKQERREKCFKQLVKQSFDPRLDETYDWEEIDCFTGRPIKSEIF